MQHEVKHLMRVTAQHGACVDALDADREVFIRIPRSRDEAENALSYCRRCPVTEECLTLTRLPAAEGATQIPLFDGIAGGVVLVDGKERDPASFPVDPAPFTVMLRALSAEGWTWAEIAAAIPPSVCMVRDWGMGERDLRISDEAQEHIRYVFYMLPVRDVEELPAVRRGHARKAVESARARGWVSRRELGFVEPSLDEARPLMEGAA